MATILRTLSYKYQWLYDGISSLATLSVGGETKFRRLALQGLTIDSNTPILDLCCGAGQTTRFLVQFSDQVTGLDASPVALQRASLAVPQAKYVQGLAEQMPCKDQQFDIVHSSVALHEMETEQLKQILAEVYRVLKPDGVFTAIDLHRPTNLLFWPPVATFMWLFETDTAWQLLKTDLIQLLQEAGFKNTRQTLYAGGSLQVVQGMK
ncbi:SAM-dependent methyltransferase [Aphanothece hegewaldii CCALA 016]|uniref:SAM-dependent methyltransferase n=1 Tax=Aphanothece hegewaldii CCALA 016 TaxID=2107694 RepID=A0A2T1M368_9CHRO|nr:class I SAM-dependent methyltransferase [Aphanothece hegewaldii]PSF39117.1 SAM-dependent methyltransferase [Aphanothece hegewaldii CCALA 016]